MSNLGKNRAACQAQIETDTHEIAKCQGEIDRMQPLRTKLVDRLETQEELRLRLMKTLNTMSEQFTAVMDSSALPSALSSALPSAFSSAFVCLLGCAHSAVWCPVSGALYRQFVFDSVLTFSASRVLARVRANFVRD